MLVAWRGEHESVEQSCVIVPCRKPHQIHEYSSDRLLLLLLLFHYLFDYLSFSIELGRCAMRNYCSARSGCAIQRGIYFFQTFS
jgi:hypothetical protein